MKLFNTAGPCDPARHYMVPAEPRLPEAPGLVAQGAYFVVHAPRQTGKTTTLRALARHLTAAGEVAALHFSCETGEAADDDFAYVRDLGLVAPDNPARVANPIYREVIVRVLAAGLERQVPVEPRRFVAADGRLDVRRLLEEFADFWREHGDVLTDGLSYHEVAPQLVLMAFLQRVVNGGGYVEREYGVGRGRIDVLVRWPFADAAGARQWQRAALELKVWAPGKPDPLPRGLAQLDEYLARLGLPAGVLVVFDRRPEAAPLPDRTAFTDAVTPGGRAVTVLRA